MPWPSASTPAAAATLAPSSVTLWVITGMPRGVGVGDDGGERRLVHSVEVGRAAVAPAVGEHLDDVGPVGEGARHGEPGGARSRSLERERAAPAIFGAVPVRHAKPDGELETRRGSESEPLISRIGASISPETREVVHRGDAVDQIGRPGLAEIVGHVEGGGAQMGVEVVQAGDQGQAAGVDQPAPPRRPQPAGRRRRSARRERARRRPRRERRVPSKIRAPRISTVSSADAAAAVSQAQSRARAKLGRIIGGAPSASPRKRRRPRESWPASGRGAGRCGARWERPARETGSGAPPARGREAGIARNRRCGRRRRGSAAPASASARSRRAASESHCSWRAAVWASGERLFGTGRSIEWTPWKSTPAANRSLSRARPRAAR